MTAILRLIRYRARGRHRAEMVADPWAPHPMFDPLTPTHFFRLESAQ